jgi:small redox-active disulfide protein 2
LDLFLFVREQKIGFKFNYERIFIMKKIQVLGTGCPKCKKLAEVAEMGAKELGIEYEIEKVTDINKITSFGIMATPALVVDGTVKVVGKVPSPDEMKELLK